MLLLLATATATAAVTGTATAVMLTQTSFIQHNQMCGPASLLLGDPRRVVQEPEARTQAANNKECGPEARSRRLLEDFSVDYQAQPQLGTEA